MTMQLMQLIITEHQKKTTCAVGRCNVESAMEFPTASRSLAIDLKQKKMFAEKKITVLKSSLVTNM